MKNCHHTTYNKVNWGHIPAMLPNEKRELANELQRARRAHYRVKDALFAYTRTLPANTAEQTPEQIAERERQWELYHETSRAEARVIEKIDALRSRAFDLAQKKWYAEQIESDREMIQKFAERVALAKTAEEAIKWAGLLEGQKHSLAWAQKGAASYANAA